MSKKHLKKSLALIISTILILSIIPFESFTVTGSDVSLDDDDDITAQIIDRGNCGANTTWEFDKTGLLTISGNGNMNDYNSDNTPWLKYRNSITSVIIGSGVTNVGVYAFYDCSCLTSVTISDSVTIIGNYSFKDCSKLTIVILGNGVTSIGIGAFARCSSLKGMTIPDSVTSIGGCAFARCSSLTNMIIPYSVKSIDVRTFEDCNGFVPTCRYYSYAANYFTHYGIQYKGVGVIDSGIINESPWTTTMLTWTLDKLGTLIISGRGDMKDFDGISTPWDKYCDSIQSIYIVGTDDFTENCVTSIGMNAFSCCRYVKSVTIENSLRSIGMQAFSGCSELTSVIMGSGVTSIGSSAFDSCYSLTNITVDNDNENFSSLDGVLFNKNKTELIFCPCGKSGTYTIPNSVTDIGEHAFSGCGSLTSVTIPDSVRSIGEYAFRGCTGLTEINYNAKSVADLTSFSNVFYNAGINGNGIEVTFGDNVEKIPAFLFYVISSWNSPKITSVTIGNCVASIRDYAFENCTTLTSITISDSVKIIGSSAFRGCTGLASITIPNSVTSIGSSAFSGCKNIVIKCYPDSYAMTYAIKNNIKYEFIKIIGDPSGDGVIDANDLTYFRKALLSGENSFDERLDVTGDGKFDLTDLVRIKKYLANKNTPLGK